MGALMITGVARYDAPWGERCVAVTGSAPGMTRLRVLVRCGRAAESAAVSVLPTGEWSASIPAGELLDLAAHRGATVRVLAESVENPASWDSWSGSIAASREADAPRRAEPMRIVPVAQPAGGGGGEEPHSTNGEEIMIERTFTARDSGTAVQGGPPDDCPHINFAPVEPGERGEGGGRFMRLEASVALPSEGTLVARLRDARTGEVLGTESADDGSLTLRDGREWTRGEHTVEVEVLSPEGCPRVSSTFRVEADADEPRDGGRHDRAERNGGRAEREDDGDDERERSRGRARDDEEQRDGRDRHDGRAEDADDGDGGGGDGGERDARRRPDVRIEVVAPRAAADGRGVRVRRNGEGDEDDRDPPPRNQRQDAGPRDREWDAAPRDHEPWRNGDRDGSRASERGWNGDGRGDDDGPRGREGNGRGGERRWSGRDDARWSPPPRRWDGDDRGRRGASRGAPACPRIRFDRPEFGDSDEDGRRRVRLCARVELPDEGRVVARLRDCDSDRVLATESSDSGRLKLRGRCDFDEGEHTVAVEILSPEQCPEVATTFRVPSAEDDDDERLRRIKQGRRHREDEDRREQNRKKDDGDEDDDDRSKWAGIAWGIAVAAYLVILSVESGFLASALAFGIASAVMAMTVGVALLSSGPARWAGWTYMGIALAVVVCILLLALTDMVSVGGVLLAAGFAAAGFAIGAAIASVYGKRREQSRQEEQRDHRRDDRYRDRETEP